MTSDEERMCSTAQSPDTGSSKQFASSKSSFKNLFRRKKNKRSESMREHCSAGSVDEIDAPPAVATVEHQLKRHVSCGGGHYHTVSGTSSVGHVVHDQFSRKHHHHYQQGRAKRPHVRSRTVSQGDVVDDDSARQSAAAPDMTSSRRQRGYFRWRQKSSTADDEESEETGERTRSTSGSKVRNWIDSFKQRSRSDPAGTTSGALEQPPVAPLRSAKFNVTPTRSLSTAEGHDYIGPVQFSEMVRKRTNSDPCFEAWLQAKAAVTDRIRRQVSADEY